MTETKPKRRWFTFSLRTLFVLVTLAAIFFGWQLWRIKQRRDYLKDHPFATKLSDEKHPSRTAPWLLWIWGERGQFELCVNVPNYRKDYEYHKENAGPEAEEIRNLFPEAVIVVQQDDMVWHTWEPGRKWDWGEAIKRP